MSPSGEPVLVRMHAIDMLDDVLGRRSSWPALPARWCRSPKEGRGVVVLIRENRATARLRARARHDRRRDSCAGTLRDYGIGAQILLDLGVHEMILLSNPSVRSSASKATGLTWLSGAPSREPKRNEYR